ncbi:phage minor head protein [Streptomyces sp. 2P-4]|uniref:phage minor head protein n=1 Tax=Streptomyces sp. 2P-4 TaxID=2931974 RepID=UPI00254105EC|nr:phage minor head protein [Streptomyces sp. 2P-4]
MAADRDRQFDQAEADFTRAVADALEETADEFARAVDGATELVAARFSVGRIARMWGARVSGLVSRLLGNVETAAEAAADDVGTELPEGWDDLPGRHETGRELPPGIGQYVETTEHLLNAVGERLADVARRELAEGLDAGEDVDALRDRLRAAFSREGAHLGPGREHLIAQTESTRAWNTGTLAAGEALTGPDRPLVKQWLTRNDRKVRPDHARANGQIQLLDDPFTVGGVQMSAPGDPTAPPAQVCNCRCRLGLATADRSAAYESHPAARGDVFDPKESDMAGRETVTAAAQHTGAMIALVPTEADARRLALDVDGAEPWEELHLTLFYLGEGADWSEDQRNELIAGLRARLDEHGLPDDRIHGRAFGANMWNADRDSPCWVWAVGDDPDRPQDAPTLESARWAATYALEDTHGPGIPQQHTPWAGHVCAAYSDDPQLLADLNERLGPITFDRIRVAFAGEHTDIPIGPPTDDDQAQEAPMNTEDTEERTAAGMAARPWHNPGDTALAYENAETGDGRVFRPGSIYWSGAGPWPLQYADEMLMGHEGAELAGAIQTVSRDGDRIPGTGVLYPNLPAGADALMILEEKGPLGVSVDLDDVSVEFVDRTDSADEDEGEILFLASLSAASLLRLDDGSWSLTASTAAEWTASGTALSRTGRVAQLITGPGGRVPAAAVRAALEPTGTLTAAAGDPDDQSKGTVVHRESSGDLLMRVTRARLRGATLVAMPAYDQARIVLEGTDPDQQPDPEPEPFDDEEMQAAARPSETHLRVVEYVKGSPVAVGARDVARALGIRMDTARGHLGRAAKAGRVVRLSRGLYVGPNTTGTDATAAAVDETALTELEASAWSAMREAPPMPAAWFKEPTAEELPPGSGGVHYADGRVYGWVAQAGVPHAGYPGKKITIERLAREGLDFSHFLRTEFILDDGSPVRVGAMTMNVGHDGDGAQCDDAVCQFDNSGTVGAIVTVGLNAGGLWFSGAGAPWLSDWDRKVFKTCQPSYHLRARRGGGWELRAVLDVPVPGHSSPLVAAVIERSNLALAASAAGQRPDNAPDNPGHDPDAAPDTAADLPGHRPDSAPDSRPDVPGQRQPLLSSHVDAVASALITSVPFVEGLAHAIVTVQNAQAARRAEVAELAQSIATGNGDPAARDEVERLAAAVFTTTPAAAAAGTTTGGEA